MIRRLAVLVLALLPSLAGAHPILSYHPPPGVAPVGGSFVANCIPYASSTTTLLCTPATFDGTNITLASGQLLLPSGSTNAPALRLGSTVGLYNESNYAIGVPIGQGMISGPVSSSGVAWGGLYGGVSLGSAAILAWSSGNPNGTQDVKLYRDAANTLALRNGTASQTARWYKSYTDGSNGEWVELNTTNATPFFDMKKNGSGTQRGIGLGLSGVLRWYVDTSGHFVTSTDNVYDIGASGATRPRNIYVAAAGVFGAQVTAGTNFQMADTGYLQTPTRSTLSTPANGVWLMANAAVNDFSRLQFGGTTSSFPAIKRVGTGVALVFADDTGPLTNATMTAENRGLLTSSTSSYTWTNAQVVALGAALEGDITVATLPAKTQVLDAAVVITGTAAGTTTLTVSCGDAIAGTPFTNYILPGDAKAAANTFYGDANAERGASLDGDPLVYLPSYTATTLVTCHYIATGANLDQVTGSTGRVILTTRLLP